VKSVKWGKITRLLEKFSVFWTALSRGRFASFSWPAQHCASRNASGMQRLTLLRLTFAAMRSFTSSLKSSQVPRLALHQSFFCDTCINHNYFKSSLFRPLHSLPVVLGTVRLPPLYPNTCGSDWSALSKPLQAARPSASFSTALRLTAPLDSGELTPALLRERIGSQQASRRHAKSVVAKAMEPSEVEALHAQGSLHKLTVNDLKEFIR
jgi:hypothetical protein